MSNWKINRRFFLSSSGSVLLLPLLESLVPSVASAAGEGDPRRFIGMYMPNGTYNRPGDQVWYPSTGQITTNLPLVLAPFAVNRGDFSIIKYLKMDARNQGEYKGGGGHASSVTSFLTCQTFTDPKGANYCTVPGSSFDQMYARTSGKQALVLSGGNDAGTPDGLPFNYSGYLSYNNGQVVEPNRNPYYLYQSMFANLAPTAPTSAPARAAVRNKSILDSAYKDLAELKIKLGKSDNIKLEQHLSNLRDLETKLNAVAPVPVVGRQCPSSAAPGTFLDNSDRNGQQQNYTQRMQAFMDMIVIAFQCDIARSVSFMYDGEVGERVYDAQIPIDLRYNGVDLTSVGCHIGISHGGRDRCINRDRYYMYLMTYLINKLKGVTDPSGSPILDNTILLNGFAVSDGNHMDGSGGVPVVVAGGRNFMKPGFSYDAGSYDMKDLLYTFNTHLGMGLNNFAGGNRLMGI